MEQEVEGSSPPPEASKVESEPAKPIVVEKSKNAEKVVKNAKEEVQPAVVAVSEDDQKK